MTPLTLAALKTIAPRGKPEILNALVGPLNQFLPQYGITTALRVRHFLAQAAQETDGFRSLEEYASGKAYEGRKDLGNVKKGDGVKYKGRGIFMVTGRANYQTYGKKIGMDLENNPSLAAVPATSVRLACEYWKSRGLNAWADRNDISRITKLINGGQNGLADRKAYYARATVAIEDKATVPLSRPAAEPEIIKPDAPIAAGPAENPWKSPETVLTGASVVTTGASAFTGVSGPIAYALAFVIVVGFLAAGYYFFKRVRAQTE